MKNNYLVLCAFLFISSSFAASKVFTGIELRANKESSVDLSSKNFIVAYFLSSDCPCSQAHFDHLNELQKKYKEFSFIGFHSSKTIKKQTALDYFSKFEIDFPIFLDNELKYANQFNALKTPHIFVLNKKGKILYQGSATNSRNPKRASNFYLRSALSALASGKEVDIKKSKALGCYIQR